MTYPTLLSGWVPGHANITGNESVDREAKKAAEGNSSPVEQLPASLKKLGIPVMLPYSKTTLAQSFNAKLKAAIKTDFTSTEHRKRL